MKKYKDLKTGEIYKLGDTLVRTETDFSCPGMPILSETTILLTEFSVNKLIDRKWIDVIEDNKGKTFNEYLLLIEEMSETEIMKICPWMVVPIIMKLIKQDFHTPIKDSEGWVFSNLTLDFVPINISKIKNPNLVTVFAKEDVNNVREIIKPLIDEINK